MSPFFSPAHMVSISSNESSGKGPSQSMLYRKQYKITKLIFSFSSIKFHSECCQIPSFCLPDLICHLRAIFVRMTELISSLWLLMQMKRTTLQMSVQKMYLLSGCLNY